MSNKDEAAKMGDDTEEGSGDRAKKLRKFRDKSNRIKELIKELQLDMEKAGIQCEIAMLYADPSGSTHAHLSEHVVGDPVVQKAANSFFEILLCSKLRIKNAAALEKARAINPSGSQRRLVNVLRN